MTIRPRASAVYRCVLVVGVVLSLGNAASARAGTYTVYSCRTPTGTPADVSSWGISSTQNLGSSSSACPAGPLTIRLAPAVQHPWDAIVATFAAPPDTTIAGYALWRSLQLVPGSWYSYFGAEMLGSTGNWVETCTGMYGCDHLGDPHHPLDAGNKLADTNPPAGVTGLRLNVACSSYSPTACPSASGPPDELQLYRADITLEDPFDPQLVRAPTGPLLDASHTLVGTEPVTVSATDRGSGVYQLLVEVDGAVVQRSTLDANQGRCAPPFATPVPCKPAASATVPVDTSKIPDGRHQLRLLVTDASQTNAAAWGPVAITTANGSCNPSPGSVSRVVEAHLLRARGHHRAVQTLTTRFGQRVRVTGRVASSTSGAPIAGASVCLAGQTAAPGSPTTVYAMVTTDPAGQFTADLAAGPSRTIWVVDRGPDGAAAARVRLRVRSGVTLTAAPRRLTNGHRVVFRGTVSGPLPKRGLLVQLEARVGAHWRVFATARPGRNRRFRHPYRFTRTMGAHTYRIRAVVPTQTGYPFVRGWSRTVAVHVR